MKQKLYEAPLYRVRWQRSLSLSLRKKTFILITPKTKRRKRQCQKWCQQNDVRLCHHIIYKWKKDLLIEFPRHVRVHEVRVQVRSPFSPSLSPSPALQLKQTRVRAPVLLLYEQQHYPLLKVETVFINFSVSTFHSLISSPLLKTFPSIYLISVNVLVLAFDS